MKGLTSQELLSLAGSFTRIEDAARSYADNDGAIMALAEGDAVIRDMLRTLVERAFTMGYSAAIVHAVGAAERGGAT